MKTAEELGKLVREVWIQWAREQPTIKEHWLTPWERLSEPDKDVDRRIGLAIQADARLAGELAGMEEAAEIAAKHYNRTLQRAKDGLAKGEVVLGHSQLICDVIYSEILTSRDAKALAAKEGK